MNGKLKMAIDVHYRADIGAKGGNLAGVLSLFYNNIDTLEDIDSSCLNKAWSIQCFNIMTGSPEENGTIYPVTLQSRKTEH